MKVKNIIHNGDINKEHKLPRHNYKKEFQLLNKLNSQNNEGHKICDQLINIIMKRRAEIAKLDDNIRSLIEIREYEQAEALLNVVENLLKELKNNNLFKKSEKEITFYL
jgi:protein-arginine kinase activator protein McsA